MNESIERYRRLVHQLSHLLEDPHPGLFSWCDMFGRTMNELTGLWVDEPKHEGATKADYIAEKCEEADHICTGKEPF